MCMSAVFVLMPRLLMETHMAECRWRHTRFALDFFFAPKLLALISCSGTQKATEPAAIDAPAG